MLSQTRIRMTIAVRLVTATMVCGPLLLCPTAYASESRAKSSPAATDQEGTDHDTKVTGGTLMQSRWLFKALLPLVNSTFEAQERNQDNGLALLTSEPGPGVLSGMVHDPADTNWHSVELFFLPEDRWPGPPLFFSNVVANEPFKITGIPPGNYHVYAMEGRCKSLCALGLPTTWPKPVSISADGMVAQLNIQMSTAFAKDFRNRQSTQEGIGNLKEADIPSETLGPYGRVTDKNGRPMLGAEVQIREYKANRDVGGSARPTDLTTSKDGYYGLRPVDYHYSIAAVVHAPLQDQCGYRYQYLRLNQILGGQKDKQETNFEFPSWPSGETRAGQIICSVVDSKGKPISAVIADLDLARPWRDVDKCSDQWEYRLGIRAGFTEGEIVLNDVPPEDYKLSVHAHPATGTNVSLAQKDITVTAGQTVRVEITVDNWSTLQKQGMMHWGWSPDGAKKERDSARSLKVGEAAPAFEVKTLDDRPLKLVDYRGKHVLLNFWASSRSGIKQDLPYLKASFEGFKQNNRFAIISLNFDKEKKKAKAYVEQEAMDWPQAWIGELDGTPIATDYGVTSATSILIDTDGKVVARNLHGQIIEWAVRKALGVTGSDRSATTDAR